MNRGGLFHFSKRILRSSHLRRSWLRFSRFQSSARSKNKPPKKRRFWTKYRVIGSVIGGVYCGLLLFGVRNDIPLSRFLLVRPMMSLIDPETAHRWAVQLSSQSLTIRSLFGLVDKSAPVDILEVKLWGLTFDNPIGLAAGFDKHGEAIDGMLDMGFGFVEIGSITPEPQEGNPKPRLFRLMEDRAIINRYGFNSEGHDVVANRLQERENSLQRAIGVIGINLGKNKTSPSALEDYSKGIQKLGPFAHYLVINVSSPNTPGLRKLQGRDQLKKLLSELIVVRDEMHKEMQSKSPIKCASCILPKCPLLVKISPDLSQDDRIEIAEVLKEVKIDGIIISNTTISRPKSLKSSFKSEGGGLSGGPLAQMSTELIRDMYRLTNGEIPIIGVGGIKDGADAYEKITAGASLVQLYSSLVFYGPALVARIKRQLTDHVLADGFDNIREAIGADHRGAPGPENADG
uniref:Dihydroorotate dehydrogenase (quinone), mitochondrial n=1 Tax=Hirondellea gigas TaxID=1518452 RepID=A0A2P2I4W3_9CRUS